MKSPSSMSGSQSVPHNASNVQWVVNHAIRTRATRDLCRVQMRAMS